MIIVLTVRVKSKCRLTFLKGTSKVSAYNGLRMLICYAFRMQQLDNGMFWTIISENKSSIFHMTPRNIKNPYHVTANKRMIIWPLNRPIPSIFRTIAWSFAGPCSTMSRSAYISIVTTIYYEDDNYKMLYPFLRYVILWKKKYFCKRKSRLQKSSSLTTSCWKYGEF